jgi:hypothetical protein
VSWFASQKLSEGTYLLAEPPHVNSYLILGPAVPSFRHRHGDCQARTQARTPDSDIRAARSWEGE